MRASTMFGTRSLFTAVILTIAAVLTIAGICLYASGKAHSAERGRVSWYSGGGTACGDHTVRPMTAAHKSLPCNAVVRVTTDDGRSAEVTIRDRGPFIRGRIIDVDPVAARVLGLIRPGTKAVTVERLR